MMEYMRDRVSAIKETVSGKIDEPEFNWLEIAPIIPQEGIIIHYTPRCK